MLTCKEKFAHVTCNLKPLASTRNSQLYMQQQRNIPKAKVMISEGLSNIISFMVIFRQETWNCTAAALLYKAFVLV